MNVERVALWLPSPCRARAMLRAAAADGMRPPSSPRRHTAELFSWASGRPISKDEAMSCARRQPGRSWEAVTERLQAIGCLLYTSRRG